MVKIYDNKKTYEFIARISYGNTAINKPTSTYLPLMVDTQVFKELLILIIRVVL